MEKAYISQFGRYKNHSVWILVAISLLFPFSAYALSYNLQPEKISDSVYLFKGKNEHPTDENGGHMMNTGFIIGGKSVMVIDAGWTKLYAEEVLAKISSITDKPVSHVVITHGHPDHSIVAGHYIKMTGAKFVGASTLADYIESRRDGQWKAALRLLPKWMSGETIDHTYPDTLVKDKTVIDLGGGKLVELIHLGGGHTTEDLVAWIPDEKILFAGDLVFNGVVPAGQDANFGKWLERLDSIKKMKPHVVIPGHGDFGGVDIVAFTSDYISKLTAEARKFVDESVDMAVAVETEDMSEYKNYPRFKENHGKNFQRAFQEIEMEAFGL